MILPKEILDRLNVGPGDILFAVETPAGIELTPLDPASAELMRMAEQIMREDRDALGHLAG